MQKKKNFRNYFMLFLCIFVIPLVSIGSKAYVLHSYPYPVFKKGSLYYTVLSSLSGYHIDSYVNAWNGYDGIKFVKVDESSSFVKNLTLDFMNIENGLYGSCRYSSRDYKVVSFYKDFLSLDSTNRAEVVVHEVGHALGLDHSETYNNFISVMRKTGFNNKPYPLPDDILGIDAIYN